MIRMIPLRDRRLVILPFVLILLLAGCAGSRRETAIDVSGYPETIRVACVGDSITYGYTIMDREENSYPAQLGRLRGDKWAVRNFGVNGATMLKRGDKPYWSRPEFDAALAFNPNAVIILLGTNDTKPQNWKDADDYVADYVDMIGRFKALPSEPKIRICLPAPAYGDGWGIRGGAVISGEIVPKIREIANKTGVPVIDLYAPLSGKEPLFPDKIHPNAEGAGMIASVISAALAGEQISFLSAAA